MSDSGAQWRNATHDWARRVDVEHLTEVQQDPAQFAPSGIVHLILEVVAYAADEAGSLGAGRCAIMLHNDGSVSVADNGRGTDTRYDAQGRPIRKPVMATKDLRYFDSPDTERLPDGHPRRGVSVVAALSEWLIHNNYRLDGAWTQRYERGVPVTDMVTIADNGTTGTSVQFQPGPSVIGSDALSAPELVRLSHAAWPHLRVDVVDDRVG